MWLKFMRSGKICAAGVPCVPQDDLGFVWTIPTTLLAPQSSYTNLPEPKEERTARDQVKGYAGIWRHVLTSRVSHVLLVPRLHDLPAPTPSLPMVQLQMNRPWDDATEDEKWRGSPPGFTVSLIIEVILSRHRNHWNQHENCALLLESNLGLCPTGVLNGQITFAGILVDFRVLRAKLRMTSNGMYIGHRWDRTMSGGSNDVVCVIAVNIYEWLWWN